MCPGINEDFGFFYNSVILRRFPPHLPIAEKGSTSFLSGTAFQGEKIFDSVFQGSGFSSRY